tara:strand:+ start:21952 stop:23208 length:1257 start_codon:yes stop_codon:yes gene_type:complete
MITNIVVDVALLQNLAFALGLGALVGLEREYARFQKKGHDYAGIRTYPLIALFGAICAFLGDTFHNAIFIAGFSVMGGIILMAYYKAGYVSREHIGATSEVAGLITFFIGALAFYGEITLAASIAIIMTAILYARSFLHNFAKGMRKAELEDTIKFAIIAFVILPFLPNKAYGPLELFNPFIIWLMVVFISGISFAGYILMKWMGEKGIALAGIMGGLVSSTAVTTSFAHRSKKQKKIYQALVLGVILANAIMFFRILIEVFVINRELFYIMLPPMLTLGAVCSFFSIFIWQKAKQVKGKIKLGSPFTLKPALKFGVLFAFVLALVKVADVYLSSKGVYLVSLISGFADVDAITVSLSQLAKKDLALEIARNGILLAALTNVAVKGGIAYIFGGKKFGWTVLSMFLVLILLGSMFFFI